MSKSILSEHCSISSRSAAKFRTTTDVESWYRDISSSVLSDFSILSPSYNFSPAGFQKIWILQLSLVELSTRVFHRLTQFLGQNFGNNFDKHHQPLTLGYQNHSKLLDLHNCCMLSFYYLKRHNHFFKSLLIKKEIMEPLHFEVIFRCQMAS